MRRVRTSTVLDKEIASPPRSTRSRSWQEIWLRVKAWAATPSGRVWLDAAQIWLYTRIAFLLLTYLVPTLLVSSSHLSSYNAALHKWVIQDGAFYQGIAQNGYTAPWQTNFWPLFPLLGHILGPVFGGDYGLSLLVVSNLAFFGALVALRRLAERELGAEAAFRTVLYLAVFPTALYTFAPYTESLFLCLAIISFALIRDHRWWLAGLVGGLSALTRSSGVLLLAPFAIEFFLAWRAGKTRWYSALGSLLIPAGVMVYSLYLTLRFHDPLAFSHSKNADWRRNLTLPWQIPRQILNGAGQLGSSSQVTAVHFVLNLGITVAFIALVVIIWRKLPLTYAVYSLAVFVYLLLFTSSTATLAVTGNGRYMLMIFPAFMVLGAWGKWRWLHHALLIGMLPLLAIFTAHFLLGLTGN
jgi:Gpi18-like mannosyltransferase